MIVKFIVEFRDYDAAGEPFDAATIEDILRDALDRREDDGVVEVKEVD